MQTLISINRYKLEGYLLVYLWLEKVKRNDQDPLSELLRLVGSSTDTSLDKEFVTSGAGASGAGAEAEPSPGAEAGAPALPTERPEPTVEMYPCIFCAEKFKVN